MAKRAKAKVKTVGVLVRQLEKELYEELGEQDNQYQEGFVDGLRTLANT